VREPYDVQGAESQAATEMQGRIGNHLRYAERVYRLLDLAISYDDEREIAVGSVDYVALLLMGRMANDMRAIATLARLGYGVQACTLAASVFEVAFTFADVLTDDETASADGTDDERAIADGKAAAWRSHTDPRHSFMSVGNGVTKFVSRMLSSPEERRKVIREQLAIYQELCQFKHGNPRFIFHRPNRDGYCDNRLGPDATHFGVLSASAAILHAGRCVALALHQWADARLLPAAAQNRFDQELAALVRHQEVVDDQTRSLTAGFDESSQSATRQAD
jgi:hypothetical protein